MGDEATSSRHLPDHWREGVIALLKIGNWRQGVFEHQAMRFLQAWAGAEGGGADYDPLNTTNHIEDAWGPWQREDYNSTGVVNFDDQFDGIVGTAATLHHSKTFAPIVADLRAVNYSAEEIVERNEAAIKTWGTSPSLMLELLKSIP
jgi:hypothetical protein